VVLVFRKGKALL